MINISLVWLLTVLCESNLPPRFWAGTTVTFMYLQDRTPMKANDWVTGMMWVIYVLLGA